MTVTSLGKAGGLTARVAEEIRAMMGRRRITGAHLARKLHVSQAWVSDRLRGITPITLTDLERIAEVLDVEAIDLIPRRPVHPPATASAAPPVERPVGLWRYRDEDAPPDQSGVTLRYRETDRKSTGMRTNGRPAAANSTEAPHLTGVTHRPPGRVDTSAPAAHLRRPAVRAQRHAA